MEYVIVTPARNEARFIERTLKSVVAQTLLPRKWIIVDDGSADETPRIVQRYAAQWPFIELVSLGTRAEDRAGGSKVVRAFNAGFDRVRHDAYDVVVKLDADLTLPPDYFEQVAACFAADPRIGLCGGYCVIEMNGSMQPESYSEDHVRGAFKAYRRACFDEIGGLRPIWAWDGIDEAAIAFHGWRLKVLPIAVIHHRPTSQEYGLVGHTFRTGREMYRERVDPASLLIISAVHLFRRPALIGSVMFLLGYLVASLRRESKVVEQPLADYIRADRFAKVRAKIRRMTGRRGR